jgi:UDP-N-acetylmuramate dehydrogenase
MSIRIRENVALAELTTFKIGGTVRYFVEVKTEEDIREAFQWAKEHGTDAVILASGSNVLIPDEGLDALVIRIVSGKSEFRGKRLSVSAGCILLDLIRSASERGLGGWEKLAGIPGTIGGAVRGNAGAFGPEIKDFVVSVKVLNATTGELKVFSNTDCDFSYRHSFFKDHPEWIIMEAEIDLKRVKPKESKKLIRETIAEREKRHLQNVRAAGSFFMNPVVPSEIRELFEKEKGVKSREGRVPAGWLIEKAGMKGAKVGGAEASHQHPNYIVNTGGASSHDVLLLAQKIKEEVLLRFGVQLEEEAALFT